MTLLLGRITLSIQAPCFCLIRLLNYFIRFRDLLFGHNIRPLSKILSSHVTHVFRSTVYRLFTKLHRKQTNVCNGLSNQLHRRSYFFATTSIRKAIFCLLEGFTYFKIRDFHEALQNH